MSQKPGRNDPCPCGSGKKFKQCCQSRQVGAPIVLPAAELARLLQAAWINRQHGRLAQAETLCHQVLQRAPSHPGALQQLGALALLDGNIETATGFLERALKAAPQNPETLSNLGFAYHEQGRLEAAAECYRKTLVLKPDHADAHYNLHALLVDAGDIAGAIAHLKQVVAIQPADMDARFMLGALLESAGETADEHFALVEQAAEVFRARLDAWRYLNGATEKLPPLTGSIRRTFQIALDAATVEGLVLEFGVRHGNSIRQLAALARQQVHGFDSFEGLPEVWHHEPKGSYTTKGVIPAVPPNVQLHVGWFDQTLPAFAAENWGPVRLLNIDCDIYSSTKTVLDLLGPRIAPGSVIVFDEYIGNAHWREDEFKAFQEAVAANGWRYEYLCFSLFTKQVAVRITTV